MLQRLTGRTVTLGLLTAALGLGAQAAFADEAAYEIWALDQGTHKAHIYDQDLKEVARINLGAHGVRVPHMVEFSSDHRYAAVANVGTGNVAVIRTEDYRVVDIIETGPRTHMAGFTPDDSAILVDVIGSPDVDRDGMVVEVSADLDAEEFRVSRELIIANDPVFEARADDFNDVAAICHDTTADGGRAFVTLGPSLDDGGLVVVDTESMTLDEVFSPNELQTNCGTMLTPDGEHMIVNGGGPQTGIWYALDVETLEVVASDVSQGIDAHGVRNVPNGEAIWMVNRGSSDGIVIDPESFEITATIPDTGPTPDILDFSPDSRYAFITLRGPNPVSMPHMAEGETPGFSVLDVDTREIVDVVEPAQGNPDSDFHGIAVRVLD
ncbi:cell surface protein [Aquisalimonas sp. 2447]|uniref:YncE family protein n=1 Tax=Aquisalimonas sp. 2447 TaxID=2740807 RepID=UPI0014324AB6|nr:cell surface protein [Aquisalimonas sp. 2447]QIT56830.1 cell surface protein [Aquisalimonas sp. 2447]